MIEPGKIETQAQLPSDSGLRCPGCDYNLTGVVEDRCPECGSAFDRAQLLARLAGAPAPIPIWDDDSQWIVVRFIKLCLLTWFMPVRVGRTFPRRHSQVSVRKFRWAVVAVTVVCYSIVLSFISGLSGIIGTLMWAIPILAGIVTCERLVAAAFAVGLTDQEVPVANDPTFSTHLDYCDGLVGLFRSFVLLQAVFFGAEGLLRAMSNSTRPAIFVGLYLAPLWWWAALSAAILVQPARTNVKVTVVLLVPLLVGIGVLVGGLILFAIAHGIVGLV